VLIVLPPSETKRDGGVEGSALQLSTLAFPALTRQRRSALAGLRSVSRSVAAATAALKLGPTQKFEIERNRRIRSSPVMPALDRYTGVLYDAIDSETLSASARSRIEDHVLIHSALFGLVHAGDLLPAYRFSHDSRVPGLPLGRLWRDAVAEQLATIDEAILDLRSEAYAELGPLPARDNTVFLRVVTVAESGQRRALNHFNKKGKGEFVRALAESGAWPETIDELLLAAASMGMSLRRGAPGELELTV
jgi:cytoplasmic iron level regulating protein YaaA (DUF328/UPF0246 family)